MFIKGFLCHQFKKSSTHTLIWLPDGDTLQFKGFVLGFKPKQNSEASDLTYLTFRHEIQSVVIGEHLVVLIFCKRRLEAVLTEDYVNGASSEVRFQGKSSSMRLMGWSAMRVSTSRK